MLRDGMPALWPYICKKSGWSAGLFPIAVILICVSTQLTDELVCGCDCVMFRLASLPLPVFPPRSDLLIACSFSVCRGLGMNRYNIQCSVDEGGVCKRDDWCAAFVCMYRYSVFVVFSSQCFGLGTPNVWACSRSWVRGSCGNPQQHWHHDTCRVVCGCGVLPMSLPAKPLMLRKSAWFFVFLLLFFLGGGGGVAGGTWSGGNLAPWRYCVHWLTEIMLLSVDGV